MVRTECYDTKFDSFTLLNDICPAVGPSESLVLDGKIYVKATNGVWIFDPIGNGWEVANQIFADGWMNSHAGTMNGQVYMLHAFTLILRKWKPDIRQWKRLGTLNQLRAWIHPRPWWCITSIENTLYIVGHELITAVVTVDDFGITSVRVIVPVGCQNIRVAGCRRLSI